MNGGTCTPTLNKEGYNCTCLKGYNGTNCELGKMFVASN